MYDGRQEGLGRRTAEAGGRRADGRRGEESAVVRICVCGSSDCSRSTMRDGKDKGRAASVGAFGAARHLAASSSARRTDSRCSAARAA